MSEIGRCRHCDEGVDREIGPTGYAFHVWSGEDAEPCNFETEALAAIDVADEWLAEAFDGYVKGGPVAQSLARALMFFAAASRKSER